MALFHTLLRLFPDTVPQENFFTEIVAYLFRADPDLLDAWLRHFDFTGCAGYPSAVIRTQTSFARQELHDSDSRVDITFDLSDGQYTDTIFLEAKISAREGPSQLQRYADQLAARPDRRMRILLYVTRDDEHPNLPSINPAVVFRHIHWYEFYRFLQSQPNHPLIQELIVYMKESQDGNRLLGLDANIKAQQVLERWALPWDQIEQTMQGRVRRRFVELVGSSWDFTPNERQQRLSRWGTFAPYRRWDESQLRCWLSITVDTYGNQQPVILLFLQVQPEATYRHALIRAMKSIATRPGWRGDDLDQYTWSGVFYIRDLPLDNQHDQFQTTLEAEFMSVLDELESVDREYSLFAI